jgi:dihydropteroate synthase
MYAEAVYTDVAGEVAHELAARAQAAQAAGIARDRIILDPGLGFAKRAEHSLAALAGLDRLAALGYPILSGPSRKSFLKTGLGDLPPRDRVWGTAAAVTASVLLGAHIVRVHDVKEMVQVVRVADQIAEASR